jgi:nicotinate-nucleotide adenylyltransferase
VFGGTFDPPHIGHLVAGLYSFEAISFDRLLFVISNIPWQKADRRRITPAADRLAMVEAAIAGQPGFEASDVEIRRGGESYTTETLAALHERFPASELYLVLGADAAAAIPTWRRAERLAELATVVVLDRPGAPEVVLTGFRVEHVTMPALAISSTDLRHRLAEGRSVRWLVPAAVCSVIEARRLYRDRP